jgi:hypothetical protein
VISVIIPSKTASNLIPCVEAVRKHEPGISITWIDDRHKQFYRSTEDDEHADVSRAAGLPFINTIKGVSPFVFARNVNIGIRASLGESVPDHPGVVDAPFDGVVLLNDDAILKTPGGFSVMAQAALDHPEYGLISATTNLAGNPQQRPQGVGLREAQRVVAFVCVYIPRTTIERVGLLDERFTAYGWEDNDYCRRVRAAGLKLGVHDGCYVDHGSLKSTFRGDPKAAGDIRGGAEIYRAKWGDLA